MWLARDKNGALYLYTKKPMKTDFIGGFYPNGSDKGYIISNSNDGQYPNVTFENSPIEVELVIKNKSISTNDRVEMNEFIYWN